MAKITYIAVISIPSFSHQASITEFCKRLLHLDENFHITCIFPTYGTPIPATLQLFKSLPPNIECISLPTINKQDLPQHVDENIQFNLAVAKSMPSFRNVLKSLCSKNPLVALIADPFANEALEIAKEFNLSSYIYTPLSSMSLSLFLHLPTLHEKVPCEFRDYTEAIHIPGCVPIQSRDLPADFNDRSSIAYDFILKRSKRFSLADGLLVNSFMEMEKGTVKALLEDNNNNDARVFLVGPIMQNGTKSEPKLVECVKWLEKQTPNSVLYVSFGSGGTLFQEQINELAFGLELCHEKFLWVLRAPIGVIASGDDNNDPLKFLPAGFLERTMEQGFVAPLWAPQTQILSHTSTGGFLTHCGWNSALESIVSGVPMITFPLFAEQRLNAVLLTDGLKVAVKPKYNENGVVEREDFAKVINDLMVGEEGNRIFQNVQKLKDAAADAKKEDGSSTMAIDQFSNRLKSLGM